MEQRISDYGLADLVRHVIRPNMDDTQEKVLVKSLTLDLRDTRAELKAAQLEAERTREAIAIPREKIKSMMDDLHSFLDMEHWEDCAARTSENECDVDSNPGEYLEDCECSIRPIHEIYAILKATLEPLAPGGDR